MVPSLPSVVTTVPGDRRVFLQERRPDNSLGAPSAVIFEGTDWSPDSIGTPTANLTGEFAKWYKVDIPQMAQMGVNTVRLYHDLGTGPNLATATAILDMFYRYRIKVIMTVDSPTFSSVGDQSNIAAVVNAFKNHPAILGWNIGNEWDTADTSGKFYGTYPDLASAAAAVEQAAKTVKALDTNHIVITSIKDPDIFGVHSISPAYSPYDMARPYTSDIVNTIAPDIDVWGLQVYRGAMFGDLFNAWAAMTTKPMYLGEYGADSYDHRINSENQAMQSTFDASLADQAYLNLSAERTNGVSLGALTFEFNDEWWKMVNGSVSTHDVSNEVNTGQPDGENDEEWFGIVDINRNPKAVYSALQARYLGGLSAIAVKPRPTIQVTSQVSPNGVQFLIDGASAYLRFGGQYGGRGISLAVLDMGSGIQMSQLERFDTYINHKNFEALDQALDSLPDGTVYALGVADESGLSSTSDPDVQAAIATLQSMGSKQVQNVIFNGAWDMIGIKGHGVLAEGVGSQAFAPVTIAAKVAVTPNLDLGKRSDLAAPVLLSIPHQSVVGGRPLSLYAVANAANKGPSATFVYTLDPGSPAGAMIDRYSGEFLWKAPIGSAPVKVTVRVTDKDSPTLTATTSFSITITKNNDNAAGDFDGDGKADVAIYDQTAATFFILDSGGGSLVQAFGNATHLNVPAAGDFDGDGKADVAIYDQTASVFYLLKSGGGSVALPFGNATHTNLPVSGDFDGDGKTDIAIYDQTASVFYILKSGGGSLVQAFGNAGHVNIPVVGDFDGDGKADVAIYDQTAATFFVLKSGGGSLVQAFGNATHLNVPAAGDFDGDGKADVAIYDQTASVFYLLKSGGGSLVQAFGNSSHANVPVSGDFDGDGEADVAIYDQTAGVFFILESGGGSVVLAFGNKNHSNKPLAWVVS